MKTKQLALCGLFSALMVICAWISLPFGDSPFTLQTFGLFLCLGALGGKYGTISVITYLLLGRVGFPAFSGFRGGIGDSYWPGGEFFNLDNLPLQEKRKLLLRL